MIYKSPFPDLAIPDDIDLTSFVFEGARARGSSVALVDAATGASITYGELLRQVRALANGLIAHGVNKGDVIGVCLPNMVEYPLVIHGICSAGAVATTLNPLYNAEELAPQLMTSGARTVVTIPPFLENVQAAAERAGIEEILVVGSAEGYRSVSSLFQFEEAGQLPQISPKEDLAILPYSSGTSGLPKGVMLTHYNLVSVLGAIEVAFPPREDEVALAVLPFFHIYGFQVVLNGVLKAGGRVVTMPRFDLHHFLHTIEHHRITFLPIVPPMALALLKAPEVAEYDLSSIQRVICGAAPLGAEIQRALAERLGCPITQGWGMTETAPGGTVSPADQPPAKYGTAGRLIPNLELRLVDPESGIDVEGEVPGEMLVRGPGVTRGYFGDPGATASTIDDDGWLHTGDVATIDRDGYITIVDRVKELIKYKGFQVAPAELEALLITHPKVLDAAVVGVPDDEAGEIPKAFIVAGDDITDEELMGFVAKHVSSYKRIRIIERVDAIPKSASGKILRRLLTNRS